MEKERYTCCFINSNDFPVERRRLSYYVTKKGQTKHDGEKLVLSEVVEEKHPHPDAPENAFVFIVRDYLVGEYDVRDPEYNACLSLYLTHDTFSKLMRKKQ